MRKPTDTLLVSEGVSVSFGVVGAYWTVAAALSLWVLFEVALACRRVRGILSDIHDSIPFEQIGANIKAASLNLVEGTQAAEDAAREVAATAGGGPLRWIFGGNRGSQGKRG